MELLAYGKDFFNQLEVVEVEKSARGWTYKLENNHRIKLWATYHYSGKALNLREGAEPLKIGDVISLSANWEEWAGYDDEGSITEIWLSYPKKQKLLVMVVGGTA